MMKKERGGVVGMGLNLLLLLAMVATNILSLYHLASIHSNNNSINNNRNSNRFGSSISASSSSSSDGEVPDHLLSHLHTIRATITHLSRRLHSPPSSDQSDSSTLSSSSLSSPPPPPPELVLYSRLAPIASACSDNPELLRRYMSYTPFKTCPPASSSAAEPLILRGCHPLPRRRCFSPSKSPPKIDPQSQLFPNSLPDSSVIWPSTSTCRSFTCLPPNLGFDFASTELSRFIKAKSSLDLTVFQLLNLARTVGAMPVRLGLDIAGGTGTLAARLRQLINATVITTTMNFGVPYNEAAAMRGLVPLHAPLQQRLPVQDGILDLVRTGHAVNRWIPEPAMEFLFYDLDRVLRPGGLLWIDHFSCRAGDLGQVYGPMIGRLGYKFIKWTVGNKTDASGVKFGEVYLTALLQKPLPKAVR